MKIGLDATPLVKLNGGIGFYIFYLLDEIVSLTPEVQFILYAPTDGGDIAYFKKYPHVQIRSAHFLSQCHSLWGQTTLAFFCWKDKLDLFWGTTQSIPLLRRSRMKTLFTLYDFVYKLYPHTVATVKCLFQRFFTKSMLHQSDRILSISHATATRLETYYGIQAHLVVHPPHKKEIVKREHNRVESFLRSKGLNYKSYFLTVGTLEPRKNVETLIRHYLGALETYSPEEIAPLVIVGGGGWKNRALLALLEKATQQYPSHLMVTGTVTDQELSMYLTGALYYISLSHYEGYGMPIQEARVCGTPIIAWNLPEMREAAEEQGIFLNPQTAKQTLEPIFKQKQLLPQNQREASPHYPTNREKAEKIQQMIEVLLKK